MNVKPDSLTNSRRRVLLWLAGTGLLALLIEGGRATLRFLTPPLTQPPPQPVVAGPPAEFPVGSLTFIPAGPAWLGRDARGFYAMSAVCPHLGCTLGRTAQGFECPCHNSRFDNQGRVLNGPATNPMTYLAVSLDEADLLIDPAQAASAETRLVVSR